MEAREFFDTTRHPRHRTFELPWEWSKQLTQSAYAAGAKNVWMVCISTFELGDAKLDISDELVIELPDGPARRAAVFAAFREALGEDPDPEFDLVDVGQPYLYIWGD